MDSKSIENLINNAVPLQDDECEVIDLAGYQVTRAELFAHSREPSITIWENRIKFNMACLRKFPGVTHIQLLIHPEEKKIVIRPCNPDAPDSLRWAKGGQDKELTNRDLQCKIFAAKVFELMGWDTQYRYKMMGKPNKSEEGELLFLFKLTDFELFVNSQNNKRKSYLPEDWKNYFGMPVETHDESFQINLADGYISTGKG